MQWRFASPKTPKERAIMTQMTPMFQALFEESYRTLIAQLETELAARGADKGEEPPLPAPKPDGLFSEMPQIQMVG
jgi:hypothetical protein